MRRHTLRPAIGPVVSRAGACTGRAGMVLFLCSFCLVRHCRRRWSAFTIFTTIAQRRLEGKFFLNQWVERRCRLKTLFFVYAPARYICIKCKCTVE